MLKIHCVDFVEYSLSLLSVTFVNFSGKLKLDFVTSCFRHSTGHSTGTAQAQMFF